MCKLLIVIDDTTELRVTIVNCKPEEVKVLIHCLVVVIRKQPESLWYHKISKLTDYNKPLSEAT